MPVTQKVKKSVQAKKVKPSSTKIDIANYVVPAGKVLCLRTSNKDGTAYGGFKWPATGEVSAPDWNKRACCGQGLHGLLWGAGGADHLSWGGWGVDALWQVVEVDAESVVDIDGDKVKFPRCAVIYAGDQKTACNLVAKHAPAGTVVHGGTATAGYRGTATAGYRGTATAGYRGTATAGDRGTATAGDRGTATAGDGGTATAGDGGTATAGYRGTATAGDGGTATAGDRGTATAGDGGVISIEYYDPSADRYRRCIAEVGFNGIKPKTKYRVVDCKLVEVS